LASGLFTLRIEIPEKTVDLFLKQERTKQSRRQRVKLKGTIGFAETAESAKKNRIKCYAALVCPHQPTFNR